MTLCQVELRMCSREGGRYIRWTPHPEIVTIRDNRDYIEVLLYSDYSTLTGWGGPPNTYICNASTMPECPVLQMVLMRSSLFERGTADGGCYRFRVQGLGAFRSSYVVGCGIRIIRPRLSMWRAGERTAITRKPYQMQPTHIMVI